jgi:hypothetical protein
VPPALGALRDILLVVDWADAATAQPGIADHEAWRSRTPIMRGWCVGKVETLKGTAITAMRLPRTDRLFIRFFEMVTGILLRSKRVELRPIPSSFEWRSSVAQHVG